MISYSALVLVPDDVTLAIDFIKEYGPVWGPVLVFAVVLWRIGADGWRRNAIRGWKFLLYRPLIITFGFGTLILSGWCYYHYRYWDLPKPFSENQIGILIAKVPGDVNDQDQAAYAQAIRLLIENQPDLNGVVSVRLLPRKLSNDPEEQQSQALKIGHWLHAKFVLRVFTVGDTQEPWLTAVDQPASCRAEAPLGKFSNAQLTNLDAIPLPTEITLLARYALAFAYYDRQSYGQALTEFRMLLAAPLLRGQPAPGRAALNFWLGICLYNSGRAAEAIEPYRDAIKIQPEFPIAHNDLGVALRSTGQYGDAAAQFRLAINQNFPRPAIAYTNLCGVEDDLGATNAALSDCNQALHLAPNFEDAHVNLCAAMLSNHQYAEGRLECQSALKLDSNDATAMANVGTSYLDEGKYDDAIREFHEAIDHAPKWAGGHGGLGLAFLHSGKFAEALREYQTAVSLEPASAGFHQGLGMP